MRKLIFRILFLIVLVVLIKKTTFAQSLYTQQPTPGEISIMASTPFPEGVEPNLKGYQEIMDCGFNLVLTSGSVAYVERQFRILDNLKLKFIIYSPYLKTDTREEYIQHLSRNKHFAGWLLQDEPKFESLNTLQLQYRQLQDSDPDNLIYINLVGQLHKTFTGSYRSLYSYLEHIEDMFKPSLWSFDFYPILKRNGKILAEYEQFYTALEAFRKISKKTNRPFWAFCESMAYTTDSYSRPAATEAYLRFEAFSALAYGAQGIVYWTYGMRESNDSEKYISALVNLNGKKTEAWNAAKKVNKEIKKYNDVFYGCNVTDLRHTGDKLYSGTRKLSGEIGAFKMVNSEKAGVVVSCIENNGSKFIVIVSRDVFNKQKIRLELIPNKNLQDITSKNNKTYNWREDINLTLEKGGYVIFKEL